MIAGVALFILSYILTFVEVSSIFVHVQGVLKSGLQEYGIPYQCQTFE